MTARDTPRPRDDLGRPLPPDSGARVEPDPPPLDAAETLGLAQDLLDQGRAFRAHEVLEARWKAVTGEERDLWRGLAQLAVGVTHAQRGNARGSAALLRRAAETLAPYDATAPYGIDVRALRAWAATVADDPIPAATAVRSAPRLRSSGG